MKINKFNDSKDLVEIYQQVGMRFAFISAPKDGYKQCHPLVLCRDFLQDAARCTIPNSGVSECKIYGFEYGNIINPPVDLNKMRMIATYADKKIDLTDSSIKMLYALRLLHHYEEIMGLKVKTRLKQIDHKDFKNPIWVFTGDKAWVRSASLISLYTFLIRLGDKKLNFKNNTSLEKEFKQLIASKTDKNDHIKDNDTRYLKAIYPKLHVLLKNYKKVLFNNHKFDPMFMNKITTVNNFHDNSGILALAKGQTCDIETNQRYKKLKV